MNLIQALKAADLPESRDKSLKQFCETFGDGYLERRNMLSKLFKEDEGSSVESCSAYYKNGSYNKMVTGFDAFDMSGKLEAEVLCESLL